LGNNAASIIGKARFWIIFVVEILKSSVFAKYLDPELEPEPEPKPFREGMGTAQ
jgi:hypothetical protein